RAHGHFGRVELLVVLHAPESLFRAQRDVGQIYALDLDCAVQEGASAVVVAASQRQPEFGHRRVAPPRITVGAIVAPGTPTRRPPTQPRGQSGRTGELLGSGRRLVAYWTRRAAGPRQQAVPWRGRTPEGWRSGRPSTLSAVVRTACRSPRYRRARPAAVVAASRWPI